MEVGLQPEYRLADFLWEWYITTTERSTAQAAALKVCLSLRIALDEGRLP